MLLFALLTQLEMVGRLLHLVLLVDSVIVTEKLPVNTITSVKTVWASPLMRSLSESRAPVSNPRALSRAFLISRGVIVLQVSKMSH